LIFTLPYGCCSISSRHYTKAAFPPPPPCPAPGMPAYTPQAPAIVPSAHIWSYFTSFEDVKPIYATYSYILSGKNRQDKPASERYLKLIEAVQAASDEHIAPGNSSKNYNVFLIPQRTSNNTEPDPNYELSRNLLTLLKQRTRNKIFDRPGPYIITLYQPITSQHDEKYVHILYLDLSGMPIESFKEFVSIYEQRLTERPINNIQTLRSFKAKFLKTALVSNSCIGFAKVAMDDLLKLLKPMT
jgi:hypothetical protein